MNKSWTINTLLIIAAMGIISCTHSQKTVAKIELKALWDTGPVFKVPESVCYDPEENILYVSNINGISNAKDSNGFISKCAMDGKVIIAEWSKGLNAPKGMGIYG